MSKFVIKIWCVDCLDDPMGCFDGMAKYIVKGDFDTTDIKEATRFNTRAEATVAAEYETDGNPYDFEIKEVEE